MVLFTRLSDLFNKRGKSKDEVRLPRDVAGADILELGIDGNIGVQEIFGTDFAADGSAVLSRIMRVASGDANVGQQRAVGAIGQVEDSVWSLLMAAIERFDRGEIVRLFVSRLSLPIA